MPERRGKSDREPQGLAEQAALVFATDARIRRAGTSAIEARLSRAEAGWQRHHADVIYRRESTLRGGGRRWELKCSIKFDGRQFLSCVYFFSLAPEGPLGKMKTRGPGAALRRFIAETQRSLRGTGLRGAFRPPSAEHEFPAWYGSFSKWFLGFEKLDRAVTTMERFERRMGAVLNRLSAEDDPIGCVAWGPLSGASDHKDCPAIITEAIQLRPAMRKMLGKLPALCACECLTCQRAWWDRGRPVHKGGKIVTFSGKVLA